jgi:Bacterial Ig domain/SdrD B-like domain
MPAPKHSRRSRSTPSLSRRCFFEPLESRNLLAVINVHLEALALDGVTPITTVAEGAEFLIRGQVEDLRPSIEAEGALQIYTDISYNAAEVQLKLGEVQRLDFIGNPVAGNFTLNFAGTNTAPIPFEENGQGQVQALAIQNALDAIPELMGNVRVDYDNDSTANGVENRYFIRYINNLANQDLPLFVVSNDNLVPDPSISNAVADIAAVEVATGVQSDTNKAGFVDAFAYPSQNTSVNESTILFPLGRNAVDAENVFRNVGGAVNILFPAGSGRTTFFVARMQASDGGGDGAVEFQISLTDKAAGLQGSETILYPNTTINPTVASQVKYVYSGDATDRLRLSVVPPVVANNDNYQNILEDSAAATLVPSPLKNDVETPKSNKGLAIQSVSKGSHGGELTIIDNGTNVSYKPAAHFFGTETFTYTAEDPDGKTDTATIRVVVTNVNDAPSFTKGANQAVREDAGLVQVNGWATLINKGANESTQQGKFIVINNNSALFEGNVAISPAGTLTFKPKANLFGEAILTVSYQDNGLTANGGRDTSAKQTFRIAVSSVNDAPVHRFPTNAATVETKPLVFSGTKAITVSDVDLGNLPLQTVLTVANGKLKLALNSPPNVQVTGNNSASITLHGEAAKINSALAGITYTANAGFLGKETFQITSQDFGVSGSGGARTQTNIIPLMVNPSEFPKAINDIFSVKQNAGTTRIDVLANDIAHPGSRVILVDWDVEKVSFDLGELTDPLDDSLTYTPPPGFLGTVTFHYTIQDTTPGSQSSQGIGTIHVVPALQAANDTYSTTEASALNVAAADGVLKNDSTPGDSALTAKLLQAPQHGRVTLKSDGSFHYVPVDNFFGADSFTYEALDSSDQSKDSATVRINVRNVADTPRVVNQLYRTAEDSALVINRANGVLKGANDLDGDSITAVLVTSPDRGTVQLNADGSFTYRPQKDASGTDRFQFRAKDATGRFSSTATATIQITAVNDAPIAVDDSGYFSFQGAKITIPAERGLLRNDADPDGNALVTLIVNRPQHGTIALNGTGAFVYTPQASFRGVDSFTYRVSDGTTSANKFSNTARVTIRVSETNQAPVAVHKNYAAVEDANLVVLAEQGLTRSGSDAENSFLTAVIDSQPTHGRLIQSSSNGAFTYKPNANFVGSDSFTYHLSDGFASSPSKTVAIVVAYQNDKPPVRNDVFTVATNATTALLPGLLTNDRAATNPDANEKLRIVRFDATTGQGGIVTKNSSGVISYSAPSGFIGTDSFTYTVGDGNGGTTLGKVSLNVVKQISSTLSGFVYRDINNNHAFDAPDFGIAGVTVQLFSATNSAVPLATTVTDARGDYRFENLQPGTYHIVEKQPAYLVDGLDQMGTQGGRVGNDRLTVTIPAQGLTASQGANNNFGEGRMRLGVSTLGRPPMLLTAEEILGSQLKQGLEIAFEKGKQSWATALDDSWNSLRQVRAQLSENGRSLALTIVVNQNGTLHTYRKVLQRSSVTSNELTFRTKATNGLDFRVFRVVGALKLSQFEQLS